jgi:methylation protein EvaC
MSVTDRAGDCRVCGAALAPFMSFGRMPIANGFLTAAQIPSEYFFELAPAVCAECGTFQLFHQPPAEQMFHAAYPFFSSSSTRMSAHFQALAEFVMQRVPAGRLDPFVVELGSNDGVMLRHLAAAGTRHLGVEPSANVAEVARASGVNTVSEFFSQSLAERVLAEHGPADVIVAANVLCHLPRIHDVAAGLALLLAPDGIVISEDPYLGDMLAKTAYDQIYDEHVFMFSATTLAGAFARHDLQLIEVLPQTTHGGSMRYVWARTGTHTVAAGVADLIAREQADGLGRPETYQRFREACERSRGQLRDLLDDLRRQGRRIVGYGATSKSTTVTNYCGIGPDHVELIADTTPIKQGKLSPGMHIPVAAHAAFARDWPDYALLFAWNHADEIFAKEHAFRRAGGKWLIYVPQVAIHE